MKRTKSKDKENLYLCVMRLPKEKKEVNVRFGKRLYEIRRRMGYSQEQLSYVLEMGRTYIGALERGEKSPTLETLDKIARKLNVQVGELV